MEPNKRERESKHLAGFLVYIYNAYLGKPSPAGFLRASNSAYGDVTILDGMTSQLCELVNSKEIADHIAKDTSEVGGRLRSWASEHQRVDESRAVVEDFIESAKGKALREALVLATETLGQPRSVEHTLQVLDIVEGKVKSAKLAIKP